MTYLASAAQYLVTWIGRANQAWGTSRSWNIGSSFETDLVAMTADRNTWHGRADQAWGRSRTWSSGESWEGEALRVAPPVSVVHLAAQAGYGTQGFDGWATNWQVSLTADRAGQWLVVGRASRSSYNSGVQLNVGSTAPGGSLGAFHGLDQGQANTSNGLAGDFWQGFLSAGQVVQAKAYMATLFSGGTLYLDMYFIPTQAYAH